MPVQLGLQLQGSLRSKVHETLFRQDGQLSSVYRAMVKSPSAGPSDLLPHTDCANSGAVGNLRATVLAVTDRVVPNGPSRLTATAGAVRSIKKSVSASESELRAWLDEVLSDLNSSTPTAESINQEVRELESDSEELESLLKTASGVYVYTYPHYWRHAFVPDTDRKLLKIGMTTKSAWERVLNQARQTAMPEDPLLLRVYRADDPRAAEEKFHKLLMSAEHERRVGVAVGTEWFATTITFCDAIAEALDLKIVRGASETAQAFGV